MEWHLSFVLGVPLPRFLERSAPYSTLTTDLSRFRDRSRLGPTQVGTRRHPAINLMLASLPWGLGICREI